MGMKFWNFIKRWWTEFMDPVAKMIFIIGITSGIYAIIMIIRIGNACNWRC